MTAACVSMTNDQKLALKKVYFPQAESISMIQSEYKDTDQIHKFFYELPEYPGMALCKVLVLKNGLVADFCDIPSVVV